VAGTKIVVGKAEDFKDGDRITVDAGNGRQIVVFRQNGGFYGLLNRCPHRGAQLCKGRFIANITSDAVGEYVWHGENRLLACPWHGWEFDITTGQSYFDPTGTRARPFPVQVESGEAVKQEIESGEASYTPGEYAATLGIEHDAGMQPGPYQAETFDVIVEEDYVVVSLRPPRPPRPARPANTIKEEAIG
jgi:nitrite reductase/ring-hydroxylating ferredoxin subunit